MLTGNPGGSTPEALPQLKAKFSLLRTFLSGVSRSNVIGRLSPRRQVPAVKPRSTRLQNLS